MNRSIQRSLVLPSALLLLAVLGCAGIGLPGGGSPAPPPSNETVVTGEVTAVDTVDREIEIDDRGRRTTVSYDANTRVLYEGREYRPENLERGDAVRVRVSEDRYRQLYAERIDVVESVQARGDGPYDDPYEDDPYDDGSRGDLSGEVEEVDASRREIRLETSHGEHVVEYDSRTPVYYRGETYRPENLERGDVVRVEVSDRGDRLPYAERIEVTRSVQEQSGSSGAGGADRLSGTVEWVDERRGEFGLRTDRETVTVELPFDADDSTRDRFARLDRGDHVRVEVDPVERDRVTLVRFL